MLVLLVTNLPIRKNARGAVSSRETLDNEAFSRRYFEGLEARLASGVRAALAPYIPIDISRAYPDDDLENELRLGEIHGMSFNSFIASLERLYNRHGAKHSRAIQYLIFFNYICHRCLL